MKNRVFLTTVVAILSLVRCMPSGSTPVAVLHSAPTRVVVVPQPTFLTREEFECWNRSTTPLVPLDKKPNSPGQLIIAYGVSNKPNLYRFDLLNASYEQLVSGLESYSLANPHAISPNGQYLWYAVFDPVKQLGPGVHLIFIYSLIESTSRQVPFSINVDTVSDSISWSADSECLILWRAETATAYRLRDGSMQQKVFPGTNFSSEVRPSPDGRWWAWPCKSGICVMDSRGQQLNNAALRIPRDVNQAGYPYYHGLVRWSPSGNVLAFAYARQYRTVMDTVRLVFLGDSNNAYKDLDAKVIDLQWSPEGDRLLLIADVIQIYTLSNGEVVTLPILEELPMRPTWSPRGDRVAYIGTHDSSIYIMNIDGTGLSQIPLPSLSTSFPVRVQHVFWVP